MGGKELAGEMFVDLCSIAKISVLIIDEKYHGYLLYCDAHGQHADTSMLDLTSKLLEETSGATVDRGHPDIEGEAFHNVQAFHVHFTDSFIKWYYNMREK